MNTCHVFVFTIFVTAFMVISIWVWAKGEVLDLFVALHWCRLKVDQDLPIYHRLDQSRSPKASLVEATRNCHCLELPDLNVAVKLCQDLLLGTEFRISDFQSANVKLSLFLIRYLVRYLDVGLTEA